MFSMNKRKKIALAATAELAGMITRSAKATPLVDMSILASPTPNGTYTNSLTVTPGETVYFEVTGEIAPVGTADNGKTITSLTPAPNGDTGYDGIDSMSFTLTDGGNFTGNFTASALKSEWSQQLGNSPGTGLNTSTLTGVRPINATGVYDGAIAPTVFVTGNFTIPSGAGAGMTSTITGKFGGTSSFFNFNTNPSTGITPTADHVQVTGTDGPGYTGYAPLTLSNGLVWGASSTTTWDTSTANFTGSTYADGNSVSFADKDGNGNTLSSAAGSVSVQGGGVNPSVVNFDNQNLTYTLSGGAIGSTASVYVNGGGTVIFQSANSYSGGTFVNNGKLQAASGALPSSGNVTIASSGSLAIGNGSSLTPSSLTTGNQTWNGGGSYLPKVDGNSSADLLSIGGGTGTLTLTATGSSAFNIVPQVGDVALGSSPENWKIATFSSTIVGYTGTLPTQTGVANGVAVSSQFVLNTSAFSEPSSDFSLSLVEISSGDDALYLDYSYSAAPEPGTAILILGGITPMFLARRRRRAGKTFDGAAARSR
jgi:autotransporter-associated beta strand protein